MATLFNTKISVTYPGLFKTIDNAAITASLKELTDGSGNQSGLYVNNAGDFKVSNILEWGSLKDTGTGVTITRYVTSTDGIENFDNNTSLPTSAAVKLYVDSKFATSDTLQEVLSFGNTTGGNDIVVSASDDITFTDTSKILMGASSDLQIYHDGSNSYINEVGTGFLKIWTNDLEIQSNSGTETLATFATNGSVSLYYDNSKKLETTNTGVDITGNLVVSGSITGAGGSFLPLAGGTMTGNTTHLDNVRSLYGTSSDLQIYHDSSNSYIRDVGTGRLWIDSNGEGVSIISDGSGSSPMAHFYKDAAVELYYDNLKKLETISTGVAVTGALSTTTNVTVGANATFVDNGKALFGASSDLQIYHDGSISKIIESTSELQISSAGSNLYIQSITGENGIKLIPNDSVELYYDNAKKIETLTDGAKVTGNLEVTGTITGSGGSFLPLAGGTMTGDVTYNDGVTAIFGNSQDLQIYHDGTHSYINEIGTGDLRIKSDLFRVQSNSGESMINASSNGIVQLYENGSEKFRTTSTGISVTGNGVFTGNVSVPDSAFLYAGTSDDLSLTHNGTDSIIRNYTGDFYINQGAVTQSIIFKVSDANALDTTALTISRNGDLTTGRDVTIAGDLTVNGTTTTVNSQTLAVVDPLIQLAKDNTANSLDIGLYGDYNDGTDRFLGLFSDASDGNKFKLFKGTTVEPTTTVNIGATGYVAADLEVAGLEATTGAFAGEVGIGTSTANFDSKLQVAGRIRANGGANGGYFFGTTEFDGGFYAPSDGNIAFSTNNVERLRIDSNGNSTFAGDIILSAGKKLKYNANSFITPENNTSGAEISTAGTFIVKTGSTPTLGLTIDASQNSTFEGGVNINSNEVLNLKNVDNTNGFQLYNSGATGATNANLIFLSGAVGERMRITSGGDVQLVGNKYLYANPSAGSTTIGAGFQLDAVNNIMKLWTNDLERLTIDSSGNSTFAGNVGIGGTPSVQLEVVGSTYSLIRVNGANTNDAGIDFGDADDNDIGRIRYENTDDSMRIWTNNAERMRITSGGEVGIGVSPSTIWSSSYDALQIGLGGSLYAHSTAGSSVNLGANIVYEGTAPNYYDKYLTSSTATKYEQDAGNHIWSTALSGTAGDAISWSERMRIDSSGNVTTGAGSTVSGMATLRLVNGANKRNLSCDSAGNLDISNAANNTTVFHLQDAALTLGTSIGQGSLSLYCGSIAATSNINIDGNGDLYINSGTSYNNTGSIFLSNQRSEISSVIVDGTANGDTALSFKTRKNGATATAMFINEFRNVMIGTTTQAPSAQLTIAIDDSVGGRLSLSNLRTALFDGDEFGRLSFVSNDATQTGDRARISAVCRNTGAATDLVFYTGNTSASVGDRMRITSTGNIEQGTVGTTASAYYYFNATTSGDTGIIFRDNASTNSGFLTYNHDIDSMKFATGGSERMRITSGGELRVGHNSGAYTNKNTFAQFGNTVVADEYGVQLSSTGNGLEGIFGSNTHWDNGTFSKPTSGRSAGYMAISNTSSTGQGSAFSFNTMVQGSLTPTERMTITSGGDVLIGTQGLPNGTSNYGSAFHKSTVDRMILRMATSTTGAAGLIDFFNPNGQVGYIATSSTSTLYVTSSDYRLKEDLQDFNGLDKVSKIPVYDFKWKSDESRSYGVMAHELQEVLPDAVSGEKDAEEMQGVDYSKIVPLLVKSIQELKAEVDSLKQKCNCKN